MANPIQELLKRSRQTWVLLAQSAIWIAGAVVGFLLPPPIGTAQQSQTWVRFAQFVITVVIGMILLAALRWKRKQDAFRWASISALFLLLGIVTFFSYQMFSAKWTTWYHDGPLLIGDVYTPEGRQYHEENPNLTPEKLIMAFAGKVEKVWTYESLQRRRLLLASMYVLAMPLFTICIMSIVQALNCAVTKSPRRKRAASSAPRPSH